MKIEEKVWVIVSKDRKVIAKGVPRERYLVEIDNNFDKKRILTYASKKKAEAGFKNSFFYQNAGLSKHYTEDDLEAVEATLCLKL